MPIKISALPTGSTFNATDFVPISQGVATNKVSGATIISQVLAAGDANVIDAGRYNGSSAPSITTITFFGDTSGLIVGNPIRLVHNSIVKYFIITAVTPTLLTVAGPPLTGGQALSDLAILRPANVIQVDMFCAGGFDILGNTTGLLFRSTQSLFRWHLPNAKLIRANFAQAVVGTGAQPRVNVRLNGNDVFSDNTNNGAILSGTANTWVTVGAGTSLLANYSIQTNQAIELNLLGGANLDSRDLTASLSFVLE